MALNSVAWAGLRISDSRFLIYDLATLSRRAMSVARKATTAIQAAARARRVGFVGDGDGPVLRGGAGEGVINEALVEETGGFVGLRLMFDGREEQRVERGMLLLDDAGDLAVTPDVPAAFEPGNERERDEAEHGPAIKRFGMV
jgi:hypothetical protein